MEDEGARKKRKRSAVACIGCHRRKVRCNVSWQGIPCSNCVEDGVSCDIYRKEAYMYIRPPPGTLDLLVTMYRPKRRSESTADGLPLSPSSTITHSTIAKHASPIASSTRDSFASDAPIQYTPQGLQRGPGKASQHPRDRSYSSKSPLPSAIEETKQDVRLFFAGESEGLEFVFDLCAPDRPARGLHYATPAKTYRATRTYQQPARTQRLLPPIMVQRELVRCFFLHVWPVLPVVDSKEFLTSFYAEDSTISPLLLWSIFFSAASASLYTSTQLSSY